MVAAELFEGLAPDVAEASDAMSDRSEFYGVSDANASSDEPGSAFIGNSNGSSLLAAQLYRHEQSWPATGEKL